MKENNMASKNTLGILLAAAGVFASGIAIGLLVSPRSGRENREYLLKNAEDVGEWLTSQTKTARDKAGKAIDEVGQNFKKVKETISDN